MNYIYIFLASFVSFFCAILACGAGRAILCREDDGSYDSTTVQFNNVKEGIWWVQFIGNDWESLDMDDLRKNVHLHELLLALGANMGSDDDDDQNGDDQRGSAATLRLAPGLLPIPPFQTRCHCLVCPLFFLSRPRP